MTVRAVRVFSRFAAGSAVATVCSQVTFVLLFGVLGASATVSGALGFVAGAIPNFVLHRCWAWQRAGRVAVRTELLPYLGVITFTGLTATAATAGVDRLVASGIDDHALRTAVLAVAFGASYLLLFVLKFLLLDRLVFGAAARREERSRHQVPAITRA
ncbi:MAG: GtrA family protein [Actinomycetota bacterium]|nr:GtrA family protein [Actinomycetota bacterium]